MYFTVACININKNDNKLIAGLVFFCFFLMLYFFQLRNLFQVTNSDPIQP